MGLRGMLLLLLLLLVAGGVGGWAYAETSSAPTTSETAPTPVSAADPAIPYTAPEVTKPDSDLPPLTVSPITHDEALGLPGEGGVMVPVPNGWDRFNFADGVQARWTAPGNPPGSYSVRVHVVDLPRSLAQAVAERAAALPFDAGITELRILDRSVDTLRASFISLDGYRRLQVTRWLSFDGNGVDLEISATGRLIDEQGLDALVAKIATEAYRQQPHAPRPGSTADPSV